MKKLINIVLFIVLSSIFLPLFAQYTPKIADLNSPFQNGDLRIKLYLHIVREDNGTGGASMEDINESIDWVKQVFDPHGIYFDICFKELNCSYCLSIQNAFDVYSEQSIYDGINGFILPKSSDPIIPAGGAAAVPLPSKTFWVALWSSDKLAHELGHCLGLEHTHRNGCLPGLMELAPYFDENENLIYGSNCETHGDLVCDTPADPMNEGFLGGNCCGECGSEYVEEDDDYIWVNPNNITDPAGNPYIDPLGYMFKNLMSYRGPRILITPGQNQRIRGLIHHIEEVVSENIGDIYQNDYIVNNYEEWFDDRVFNANIIVQDGGFLKVFSKIEFTSGHGILVKKGGELYLSGAELNKHSGNYCVENEGTYWEGIQLETGTDAKHAKCQIWLSKIYNAKFGIQNTGLDGYLSLFDHGSEFKNNLKSISLTDVKNVVYFNTTTFHIEPDFAHSFFVPGYAIKEQISLSNCDGVHLAHCKVLNHHFNDLTAKLSGIGAYESNLLIRGSGSINGTSEISTWGKGIYGLGSSGMSRITHTSFSNNYCGIRLLQGKNHLMMNNDFFKDDDYPFYSLGSVYDPEGIQIQYETSYNISFNQFNDLLAGVTSREARKQNLIENNAFLRNSGPVQILFANALPDAQYNARGLKIHCNKFDNTIGGDIIAINAVIDDFQGEPNLPAENQFSNTGSDPFRDFWGVSMALQPTYYYSLDNPTYKPDEYIGMYRNQVNTQNGQPLRRECNIPAFDPDIIDPDDTDEDDQYTELDDKYTEIEDSLTTKIDGGDTRHVITIIQSVNQTNVGWVVGQLLDLGPWLSVEATTELFQTASFFTQEQLVNILCASPDVINTFPVQTYINDPANGLTALSLRKLELAANRITARTILNARLSYTGWDKQQIVKRALDKVTFTYDGPDYVKQRTWLERRNDFESRFLIAETYYREGNIQECVAYLTALTRDKNLSGIQKADVHAYIDLIYFLNGLRNSNRNEYELTPSEILIMEQTAYSTHEYASQKAQNLLMFFYGYEFERVQTTLQPRQITYQKSGEDPELNQQKLITVFPNPNAGIFKIKFEHDSAIGNAYVLSIKDILGNEISSISLTHQMNITEIDLLKHSKGIYFYELYMGDDVLDSGQIFVQ